MSHYALEPQPSRKGCAPILMPIALLVVGVGLILNAVVSFTQAPPAPPTGAVALAEAPATATPVPTVTATRTPLPSNIATLRPANLPTDPPTATPLPTATDTATPIPPTATWTSAPPTQTSVPTGTATPVPTATETRTPVPTATERPTRTPTPTRTHTPTPDPLAYDTICGPSGSSMTEAERLRYAGQYAGVHIYNWEAWVYDVTEIGFLDKFPDRGRWKVTLAMRPRGLFLWSGNVVVYDIPAGFAESLSVEQPVRLSGRIAEVGTVFGAMCNPVYVVDASLTLR